MLGVECGELLSAFFAARRGVEGRQIQVWEGPCPLFVL